MEQDRIEKAIALAAAALKAVQIAREAYEEVRSIMAEQDEAKMQEQLAAIAAENDAIHNRVQGKLAAAAEQG